MMRESPPELFAQRPVRSEYGRRSAGPRLIRRILFLSVFLAVLGGLSWLGYTAWWQKDLPPGEIPTIQADGPIMKRPDEPGGLDVPHQDVQVFQQLDRDSSKEEHGSVEHLLPPPETPQPPPEAMEQMLKEGRGESSEAIAEVDETLPPAITLGEPIRKTEKLIEDAQPVVQEKAPEMAKAKDAPPIAAPKKDAPPIAAPKKEEPKAAIVVDSVKKETPKKTKAKTEQAVKAEEAMGHLPQELFTMGQTPEKKAEEKIEKVAAAVKPKPASSSKMRRVQFASFPEKASAEAALSRFEKKYADVLRGLSLSVVQADLGVKGIYYRIMSDSAPEDKAKEICEGIKSRKGSCLLAR